MKKERKKNNEALKIFEEDGGRGGMARDEREREDETTTYGGIGVGLILNLSYHGRTWVGSTLVIGLF